jgi:hypothetical protein
VQFLLAPYVLTYAPVADSANERQWLSEALAAADARDGRRADRSRLDVERDAVVPGASVAAVSGGLSTQWWWETVT